MQVDEACERREREPRDLHAAGARRSGGEVNASGKAARSTLLALALQAAAACLAVAEDAPGLLRPEAVDLPPGVEAVWEPERMARLETPTRAWRSINGLWLWRPSGSETAPPAGEWGYFKVPGPWPGITSWLQKDSQTLFAHPRWSGVNLRELRAAWYQREIAVPRDWEGRRIVLQAEYINSLATAFVDGRAAGMLSFPAGELELTPFLNPGAVHRLALRVEALPLGALRVAAEDKHAARAVEGRLERRGLCGDLYLASMPRSARLRDVKVDTSVRHWRIGIDVALDELLDGAAYRLRAVVTGGGRPAGDFTGPPFSRSDLAGGRFRFASPWKPERLWDLHRPENIYRVEVSLLDGRGEALDVYPPQRFGFRELWIEGRDFYLNGTPIHLSSAPLALAQIGTASAHYAAARETLERLKSFGVNYVFTHHYDCRPGAHLSFAEILRAADDVGMLVGLSQPHFQDYDWEAPEADTRNGYRQHAAFYVRAAQNHPSVVFHVTSHNALGYAEDMDPEMIDGVREPASRSQPWAQRNLSRARRAEAVIRSLDSTRIVYHHASGNTGPLHTSNFYTNWAPIQELDDWFEPWATRGEKPVMTVEYGCPFLWDWAMFRGWFEGERSFGSARVPWEFCQAEWSAQFFGAAAYRLSEAEKANLRWEARQFREGRLWHRWDYPHRLDARDFEDRFRVIAAYLGSNLRSYRAWGKSGYNTGWDLHAYWTPRDGAGGRRELPVDWKDLQRPGFSPDYVDEVVERVDYAFERSDWVPTAAAEALMRNNRPLLAYIAGKPGAFTGKDQNFLPGETVEKQIIVLNDSRETVRCDLSWRLDLERPIGGKRRVVVETGRQERVPLDFRLPEDLRPGTHAIIMTADFGGGRVEEDSFEIHVLAPPEPLDLRSRIALYDPAGETAALLGRLGVRATSVAAGDGLEDFKILIVGKGALAVGEPAPAISGVRAGLKVIVFEQSAAVLERRFGFRTAEYGLRWVFPRVADHPALRGLGEHHLRNWRGAATNLPPRLGGYELDPRKGPVIQWCGIPLARGYRAGNRGSVASVLIEKPARGDFLALLDGGFALQYASLLEYREGEGLVMFCQADVSGRSEPDPAAEALARNLLWYVSEWKPAPRRRAVYVGEAAGRRFLEAAGFALEPYRGRLAGDRLLVVAPGGGRELAGAATSIAEGLEAGGRVLAIGLGEDEANAFLPFRLSTVRAEHIAASFAPFDRASPLRGISPAEAHNRDPREVDLVAAGAEIAGNGVLAAAADGSVVFCQLVPWHFEPSGERKNLKRTFRGASRLLTRLLANLGVEGRTQLLDRFARPAAGGEKRWLGAFYLDEPEEWDDPYRAFRW
jgi:beta-galactosidase